MVHNTNPEEPMDNQQVHHDGFLLLAQALMFLAGVGWIFTFGFLDESADIWWVCAPIVVFAIGYLLMCKSLPRPAGPVDSITGPTSILVVSIMAGTAVASWLDAELGQTLPLFLACIGIVLGGLLSRLPIHYRDAIYSQYTKKFEDSA